MRSGCLPGLLPACVVKRKGEMAEGCAEYPCCRKLRNGCSVCVSVLPLVGQVLHVPMGNNKKGLIPVTDRLDYLVHGPFAREIFLLGRVSKVI